MMSAVSQLKIAGKNNRERRPEKQNARRDFVRAQHLTLIYLSHKFAPPSSLKMQSKNARSENPNENTPMGQKRD
jgi:hypothetical protein